MEKHNILGVYAHNSNTSRWFVSLMSVIDTSYFVIYIHKPQFLRLFKNWSQNSILNCRSSSVFVYSSIHSKQALCYFSLFDICEEESAAILGINSLF